MSGAGFDAGGFCRSGQAAGSMTLSSSCPASLRHMIGGRPIKNGRLHSKRCPSPLSERTPQHMWEPPCRCAAPLSLSTFDVAPRSGLLYPLNQPSYIGMQDGNGHANPSSKQSAKGQSVAFLTSTRQAIRNTVWAFPNCRATMHQETPFELRGILFDPKPFAILRMHMPRTRDLFPSHATGKKPDKNNKRTPPHFLIYPKDVFVGS